jgi:hypothetical protein
MRAFVLSVLLTTLVACDHTVRSIYPTRDDAEKAHAIERGWIPSALPPSSKNIEVAHDPDSNSGNGGFDFDPSDSTVLRRHLSYVPRDELEDVIRQFAILKRLEQHGFYQFEDFFLAVDWENSKGKFYLRHRPR